MNEGQKVDQMLEHGAHPTTTSIRFVGCLLLNTQTRQYIKRMVNILFIRSGDQDTLLAELGLASGSIGCCNIVSV